MLQSAERAVHGTPLLSNNQRACKGILNDLPLTPISRCRSILSRDDLVLPCRSRWRGTPSSPAYVEYLPLHLD